MAEEIRVLLVEPMKEPKLITIENSLERKQELVGGLIQCIFPWTDDVVLVADDEGKLKGCAPNRLLEDYDIICGPFFIAGLSEDDFASISDEMAERYRAKFRYPEMFARTTRGSLLCFRLGSGQPPLEIG